MPFFFDLLYGLILLLLSPWLIVRAFRTGRYRQNLRAKLLGPTVPEDRIAGPVVWFHGVSVGEIHLLRQVVGSFRQRHPEWQIVVSSTTDTGLAEARKHFADLTVIAYPLDFSWTVRRAMTRLRPRLIVLAESELWPNFLHAAGRAKVPVIVVNGRMSPRTFRRLSRVARIARRLMFDRVTVFGVQSETYARHLKELGVPPDRVVVTGSVKYDGVSVEGGNPKTEELRCILGLARDDVVWVAGSTHEPEERIVSAIYRRLADEFPTLRLIIVPRSPDRFVEVAAIIEAAGLPCVRRSRIESDPLPSSGTRPILLIDTLGELGAVWGLATIGFTGGSLNKKRGGQSMIEPAGLGVPVLFGPHTWNFRDAVAGLLEAGGAIVVGDATELEREVRRLIGDEALRKRMGAAGKRFVATQQGATHRTLDLIDRVISSGKLRSSDE